MMIMAKGKANRDGELESRSEDQSESNASRRGHGFEPTMWTGLIKPAGSPDDATRLEALGRLYEKYQLPMRAFLKANFQWKYRVSDDWIGECLQQFIHDKILCSDLIAKADRERGRFRDLLKTSLSHFATDYFWKDHGGRIDFKNDYRKRLKDSLLKDFLPSHRVDEGWIDKCLDAYDSEKIWQSALLEHKDSELSKVAILQRDVEEFATNRWRQENGLPPQPKPGGEAGAPPPGSPAPTETGPSSGDREWAEGILQRAIEKLEAECRKKNQAVHWLVFERRRLSPIAGEDEESLEETAQAVKETLGKAITTDQVSARQKTMEGKLGRLLVDELSEYCPDQEGIEEELRHLISIFSSQGG